MKMSATILAAALFALAVFCSGAAALVIDSTTNVLTWSLEPCPSDWTSMENDNTYKGRTILGAILSIGSTSNTALSAFTQNPTHTHSFSYSVTFSQSDSSFTCSSPSSSPPFVNFARSTNIIARNTFTWTDSGSSQSQNGQIYPSIVLNLCKLTSGSYYVPAGVVLLSSTSGSCPTGTSTLSSATAKYMVFASSTRSTATVVQSPSLTTAHSHVLNNVPFAQAQNNAVIPTDSPPTCSGSTKGAKAAGVLPAFGALLPTGSADLNIPYVNVRACTVTDASGELSAERPAPYLIFYFNGQSCPTYWRDSTTIPERPEYVNISGRIIFSMNGNAGVSGKTFGTTNPMPLAMLDDGTATSEPHSHSLSKSGYQFAQSLGCSGSGACGPNDILKAIGTPGYDLMTTTQNTDVNLPVVVLRACSVIPLTSTPTWSPSTSPSISTPTSSPSKTPSFSPTVSAPTASPSMSPSNNPTKTGDTLKPSGSPSVTVTKQPTKTPTLPPTDPKCRPLFNTKIKNCKARVKYCSKKGIGMKWTGPGCKDPSTKAGLGDGGCQCRGYCGFVCERVCKADRDCMWQGGKCYVKATNQTGQPIPQCYPPF